jgi:hypothetical protein
MTHLITNCSKLQFVKVQAEINAFTISTPGLHRHYE